MDIRLKHRLARSPLRRPIESLRAGVGKLGVLRRPELALLRREHDYLDRFLSRTIRRDWTCVDVGGHVGSFSAELARLAPKGRLIIVEADPVKAKMLAEGFPKAVVHAVAVSDEDGEATFYRNTTRPGYSSLSDRSDRGRTEAVTVPRRRLDALLADEEVRFVKLDVEGFELEAVRGARDTFARCRPILVFEAGAAADRAIDTSKADALFASLTGEMGYDVFAPMDLAFHRPPLDASAFDRYRRYPFLAFNYVAIPRPDPSADPAPQQGERPS